MEDEIKKLLDKTFYYINGLYTNAVSARNTAIEMTERFESIKAALQINEHIDNIELLHRQGKERIKETVEVVEKRIKDASETETAEIKAMLDENIALWHQALDKIKAEKDSLLNIADDVTEAKLNKPIIEND